MDEVGGRIATVAVVELWSAIHTSQGKQQRGEYKQHRHYASARGATHHVCHSFCGMLSSIVSFVRVTDWAD